MLRGGPHCSRGPQRWSQERGAVVLGKEVGMVGGIQEDIHFVIFEIFMRIYLYIICEIQK